MGRLSAIAMRGEVDETTALLWHLQYNHYPPVPASMVTACQKAIDNANNELWDKQVRLPVGVTFRGKKFAPTRNIIAQHHLDTFLAPAHEFGRYCECVACEGYGDE